MGAFNTVDEFSQDNLKRILQATKISNDLPGEKREDYDYYATFPEFRKIMTQQGKRLREMMKSQFNFHGIKAGVSATQVEDLVDLLTDANDTILERINMNLDEAAGMKRDVNPLLLEVSQSNVSRVSGSWNNFDRTSKKQNKQQDGQVKLLTAKNVLRPQVNFKQFIDNSKKPFTPRIRDKPNSKKPLSILIEYDDNNGEFFSHPYFFEIERFNPTPQQLAPRPISLSMSVEKTELVFVETRGELVDTISDLKEHNIIGVDLEAHTYRSYLGFTCLIQISTVDKDYLIDPFKIWEHITLLNEITTDPKIVKVFHGCDSDVVWLQRDFSVYLVNVFDTHQAGKLLGLPRLSLSWLLEHYCKIYADKQYQLADWRIRPLPSEMTYYARQDTRYLIFLYEKLKIQLLEKANQQDNLLRSAIQQSSILCTTRYNKPIRTSESHLGMLKKSKSVLNNKQLFALKEIFEWRDETARSEDESCHYIIPNHMLLKICTELPREMQGILACCNPIPPLVKQHLQTLHMIILKARSKPLQAVDPDLNSSINPDQDVGQENVQIYENPLKCPMDLSNMTELGSGLPTMVKGGTITPFMPQINNNNLAKKRSSLGIFDGKKKSVKPLDIQFVSPFKRYSLLKPYLESIKPSAETPESQAPRTDDLRLASIHQHFQRLTEMTPKPKKVEKVEEEEDEEEAADISDDEVVPLRKGTSGKGKDVRVERKNDVERQKIVEQADKEVEKRKTQIENKLIQEEINERKKKKRKSTEPNAAEFESKVPKTTEEFEYENVDFNQMFAKRGPRDRKQNNDFHPGRDKKNNKDGAKMKQKSKNNGKSFTFKK